MFKACIGNEGQNETKKYSFIISSIPNCFSGYVWWLRSEHATAGDDSGEY